MPQITLVDSEFYTQNSSIICHMVNTDDRASGHLYRDRTEKKIYSIVIVRHIKTNQYPLLHHRPLRTVSHP
jgi:hypothetical protein